MTESIAIGLMTGGIFICLGIYWIIGLVREAKEK